MLILLYFSVNVSWEEAANKCLSIGGHLPFIKSYGYTYYQQRELPGQYNVDQMFGNITFIGLQTKVS